MTTPRVSPAQSLGPLVQWWLSDKQVELTYDKNLKHNGRLCPEYDAVYWLNGRRITEKALGFLMLSDFFELNHRFSIVQILAALLRFSWNHYCETHEYTDEDRGPPQPPQPAGRKRLSIEEIKARTVLAGVVSAAARERRRAKAAAANGEPATPSG